MYSNTSYRGVVPVANAYNGSFRSGGCRLGRSLSRAESLPWAGLGNSRTEGEVSKLMLGSRIEVPKPRISSLQSHGLSQITRYNSRAAEPSMNLSSQIRQISECSCELKSVQTGIFLGRK